MLTPFLILLACSSGPSDPEVARCAATGNGDTCHDMAITYLNGEEVTDEPRFLALELFACSYGNRFGCHNLGAHLSSIDTDHPHRGFYTMGCSLENGESCRVQGHWRRQNEDGPGAVSFFTRGCELEDADACYQLGVAFDKGRYGLSVDPVEAAAKFSRGCEFGSAFACNDLGVLAEKGLGMPKDLELSQTLYAKACELGSGLGCHNRTLSAPQNKQFSWLKKGCDLGNGPSCNDMAFALLMGQGVPKDLQKALRVFEDTCASGHALACRNAGLMFKKGDGVPTNTERALDLFEKACELGDSPSCEEVK